MEGQIVKIISNLYYVQTSEEIVPCHSRGLFRGKNITPMVGDYCTIDVRNKYILKIHDRKNELVRPFVSNVDQGLLITSLCLPDFSFNLLDKLILIMEINNIKPIICITKEDLLEESKKDEYKKIFEYYKSIGYDIYYNYELSKLKEIFKDKVTVFTGQTGSGKSTLFNSLCPSLNFETGSVSVSLGRGRHTTRCVTLVSILDGKLVDTPGFSSIDLSIYTKDDIKKGFIEFRNISCKYKDCMHIKEDIDNCFIKQKVKDGEILKSRYDNYVKFIEEIKERGK